MNRASLIFLILSVMIFSLAFADDSDDKTITGSVSSLDWVASKLSVGFVDPYSGNSDEIGLRVTGDSELTRGTDSISLSDINQGDPVSVTYYKEDFSGLKIRRLEDLNNANE